MSRRRKQDGFLRRLPAEHILQHFKWEENDTALALRLGTTRNKIRKMRFPDATITWLEADRFAINGGTHPAFIWGELWMCELSPVEETQPIDTHTMHLPPTEEPCNQSRKSRSRSTKPASSKTSSAMSQPQTTQS